MKVKVKYEETISRLATIDVDEQDLLDYINLEDGDSPFGSLEEARSALGEDFSDAVKEFLEDGSEEEWAQARDLDPFAEVYDKHLLDVEVQ